MTKLTETFCNVDDFCKIFISQWEPMLIDNGIRKRRRDKRMSPSEIMTIIIRFAIISLLDWVNRWVSPLLTQPRLKFAIL